MRLKAISIEGFRGFTERIELDLAADVIILHGPNGVGKTSLLDAILWVLTGRIDRFGSKGGPVSLYAREGIARVELSLQSGQDEVVVVRATDGERNTLRLRCDGEETDGSSAEERLCGLLLPHLKGRHEAPSALTNVLTRGVYLQQDLVRQFIDTDTASERFGLVSEVIGAGVVLELQQALEKSRNQWSRNTNALRKEALDPLRLRLDQVDDQVTRLEAGGAVATIDARAASETFFQRAVALLGPSRVSGIEAPTNSGALDRLLKELSAERARVERELGTAASLMGELGVLSDPDDEAAAQIEALADAETTLSSETEAIEQQIAAALADLSAQRDRELAASDKASRAATLALIALENLGDVCPVCLQSHDVERTTAHLKDLVAASQNPLSSTARSDGALERLNAARTIIRTRLEALRTERADLMQQQRANDARREVVVARLADFGVPGDAGAEVALAVRRSEAERALGSLASLIQTGEQLSLSVVRLGEQRRRTELLQEKEALLVRVAQATSQIEAQERTHALAGRIIDELRGASLAVTTQQVERIAPLFQRIYSRIDPHPTFRVTQILTSMERGKGQLNVGVADPQQGGSAHDAGPILSSSQLNSFAVSLFLSLNLALPSLRLAVTMLDDPLQSLDAINLLGLVDVLRRFRTHRQIIVSTHEPRLLGLLQRKLRPVKDGERMVTLIFEDWTRAGPSVRTVPAEHAMDDQKVLAA